MYVSSMLSCTYLAHYELESEFIIVVIIVVVVIVVIIINNNIITMQCESLGRHPQKLCDDYRI